MNTEDQKYSRPPSNKMFTIFFVGLVIVLAFFFGFEIGRDSEQESYQRVPLGTEYFTNTDGRGDIDFDLFWEAWELVSEKYVDRQNVDAKELFYGAINGMMQATGDPYTSFLAPDQLQALNEELGGSFEGIGAEIDIRDNILIIVAPLADSPAERAGLLAGDRVLEIDEESTIDISIEDAIEKIRGPRGTAVVFQVFREGEENTLDITIERDVIDVESVRLEIIGDGTIAHIRITQFGEETATELADVARAIKVNPIITGIVVDMRNNPGGLLNVTVDAAGIFLAQKKIVVIEEDGHGNQEKIFTNGALGIGPEGLLMNYPTVVLINQGSASAAEILAGALRDHREGIEIIGKTSFGKGSVQELIELGEETAAKITTERWLTPNGEQINEKGIDPDHEVEITSDDIQSDRDPQLDKAIEVLQGKL